MSVFDDVQALLPANPERARATTDRLVAQQVVKLAQDRDLSLHLLADTGGVTFGVHGVNVSVLSLLLGKTLGLRNDVLQDLGTAALLHDIGKPGLEISASANALNQATDRMPLRETTYARHVGESVALALSMGYPPSVTTAIAQHHEWADGSGFPLGLLATDMDVAGQILALANNFERLCNLPLQGNEMTPTKPWPHCTGSTASAMHLKCSRHSCRPWVSIRRGPWWSLSDGRMGVVVSVNTSQSLKPQVLTYDTQAAQKLRFVDLLEYVGLGIRRGLTRNQLSRNALEALQPQRRLCYFLTVLQHLLSRKISRDHAAEFSDRPSARRHARWLAGGRLAAGCAEPARASCQCGKHAAHGLHPEQAQEQYVDVLCASLVQKAFWQDASNWVGGAKFLTEICKADGSLTAVEMGVGSIAQNPRWLLLSMLDRSEQLRHESGSRHAACGVAGDAGVHRRRHAGLRSARRHSRLQPSFRRAVATARVPARAT